jgi:hypothetical protein
LSSCGSEVSIVSMLPSSALLSISLPVLFCSSSFVSSLVDGSSSDVSSEPYSIKQIFIFPKPSWTAVIIEYLKKM